MADSNDPYHETNVKDVEKQKQRLRELRGDLEEREEPQDTSARPDLSRGSD